VAAAGAVSGTLAGCICLPGDGSAGILVSAI
jgi:hypothetical protein